MLEVVLVSTGLMLCQQPVSMDGGVVKFEEAPQWILADGNMCWPQTKLSPDARGVVDAAMAKPLAVPPIEKVSPPSDGITETTIIPPRPIKSVQAMPCLPTYSARTVDLQFRKGQEELTPESSAALVALLADAPKGLTLVIGRSRNDEPKPEGPARQRVDVVRALVAKFAASSVAVTEEERVVKSEGSRGRVLPSMEAIGVFVRPCPGRSAELRPAPSGLVPTVTGTRDSTGGGAMAR